MLGSRRRRPDAARPPSTEPLAALQSEEYWQRSRESLEKYLKTRSRDYRTKAILRYFKDFAKRNASHARETFARAMVASLILLVPFALDWWIEHSGLGAPLRQALRTVFEASGILPIADAMRTTGALGAAAVQIAGVSLPLFYTVVSASLVSSYARAPESVRAFALNRSFVTFFEVPAWVLGIWGVTMVGASEMGLQPGIMTRIFVAGLAAFVLAAVPLAFWRVVASASPGALVYEMVEDIRSILADVKEELRERADPEMLKMLRGLAARQTRAYVELASFIDEAPIRSQSAARHILLGAAIVLESADELQGRLPTASEWHANKAIHTSPFHAGGMPGPAASVRLPLESRHTKDSTWLERAMGEAMRHALTAALKEGDDSAIGFQLEVCRRTIESTAANGHLEGALAIQHQLRHILKDASSLDERGTTIAEDGISNLFNAMIDGIAAVAPKPDEIARTIHEVDSPLHTLPQGVGEGLRKLAPQIRLELLAERRIEQKIYTPVETTIARLTTQAAADRSAAAEKVVSEMLSFFVERARKRSPNSRGPGIPPLLHAYHTLSRMQRKLGELETPLHELDKPSYALRDTKLMKSVLLLRRRAIASALVILGDIDDITHEPEQTDLIGTLYYLTALEMVTALSDGEWPNAPKQTSAFLERAFRIFGLQVAELGPRPPAGQSEVVVAAFREAWRVAGYALLWAAVHNPDQETETKKALKTFVERTAVARSIDPKDLLSSWTTLLDLGTFSTFSYVDSRFNQDNDMWDALVRRGLAQPITQTGYGPTSDAKARGNHLLNVVSREPGDALHEMDAMAMAIVAEELGIDPAKLSRPVQDARRDLKRNWGKYGPPRIPGSARRTTGDDEAFGGNDEDPEGEPEHE